MKGSILLVVPLLLTGLTLAQSPSIRRNERHTGVELTFGPTLRSIQDQPFLKDTRALHLCIHSVLAGNRPAVLGVATLSDTGAAQPNKRSRELAWIKKNLLTIFNLDGLKRILFGFPFWGALIFTLTLERLIPAEPNRKIFSVGLAHDLMWFLYEPVLHALIVGTYVALVAKIYKTYFSYLTFSGLNEAPGWVRFTVALLLVDLGYWVQHYINHKVPFLWKLHCVHHSQEQLNFFTDFRYHPLEYIVRHTFITIPFLFLNVTPPVIVAFAVVKEWFSRFYHGNIRTNLGPLRYILVTPQSHRVHHSREPQHWDMNFGGIFSIWDFLFRKQYKGFDEYPATGVVEQVPLEQRISLTSILFTPWRQMLYPLTRRSETLSK